jgi:hypothetical protein
LYMWSRASERSSETGSNARSTKSVRHALPHQPVELQQGPREFWTSRTDNPLHGALHGEFRGSGRYSKKIEALGLEHFGTLLLVSLLVVCFGSAKE